MRREMEDVWEVVTLVRPVWSLYALASGGQGSTRY